MFPLASIAATAVAPFAETLITQAPRAIAGAEAAAVSFG